MVKAMCPPNVKAAETAKAELFLGEEEKSFLEDKIIECYMEKGITFDDKSLYKKQGEKYIFTELVSELESKIEGAKMQAHNFTTQGASTSGEYGSIAMINLTNAVVVANKDLLNITI